MRVFVTGGTGAIGRFAVPQLVDAGHEVTALARSSEKASQVEAAGARAATGVSLFDRDALQAAFAGHDTVLNLATAIPRPSQMWRTSAWAMNDSIRSEGSTAVVDAAIAAGVGRLVQESITFGYRSNGDDWITEETPDDMPDAYASLVVAERNAARFREHGDSVVLRFAAFYGPGSEQTAMVVRMARAHVAVTFGSKHGFQSNIHLEDAASAAVAALGAPSGTYNVGDDQPMRKRELADAIAAEVGASVWLHSPGRLVRLVGSGMLALLRSQRISNRKLRDATGWEPRYPSARDGYAALIKEHVHA